MEAPQQACGGFPFLERHDILNLHMKNFNLTSSQVSVRS